MATIARFNAGEYNTTIYGLDDRYRGIRGGRGDLASNIGISNQDQDSATARGRAEGRGRGRLAKG